MPAGRSAAAGEFRGMIGVLGPPVTVTSAGTRSLRGLAGKLLVALCASDEPVPVDRLIDILWSDAAPPTARAALHVHLGTLRQALREGPPGLSVERTDAGYRLCRGAWQLDADVAAEHAAKARALLDHDPPAALAACRAALPLWRGPAFTVAGETVAPIAAQRAAMLRLEVEELHVAALLACGDLGDAEQVALRLVEEEPYRELRWAQLLRARYHAGRVRDALVTYQDARRALTEGLGVEPGPLLRDLERAVLTHDEALLRVHRALPPAPHLPPPARVGGVFGRGAELHRCATALADGRPVVIHGPPGVGKTTLATELAAECRPGAVLWVDLRFHATTGEILAELTDHLRHGVAPGWARTGGVELVVFDNAEGVVGPVAEVVDRLRRVAPAVRLLVTSRSRVPVDAVFVPVAPLPLPDQAAGAEDAERSPSVRALRAAVEDLAPGVELGTDDAIALCRQSGGLPLALRLFAAAARSVSAEELVKELPEGVREGVLPVVEATLALADPQASACFRRLGVVRHAFDAELAAAVAGVDGGRARRVLVILVDLGLVQVAHGASPPYSLVEPIRDAAEQLLNRAGETALVLDRLVDWSLRRARVLRQETMSACGAGAATSVSRELPRFHRIMDNLVATADHRRGLELVRLLDTPLYLAGRWPERIELLDRALSIPGPPNAERALVLGYRGRPGPLSAMDPERLEASLDMAARAGADAVVAYVRHLRGILRWWQGDLDMALADHRHAAQWFEAQDDPRAIEVRKYEAVALVHAGAATEGTATLRRTATEYRKRGQPFLYAHTTAFLGHCQRFLGDDDAALANWRQAIEVFALLENNATAIHVELGLGELAVERHDREAAGRHAGAALQRTDRTGSHEYETWGWTVALRAAAAAGDRERADACARSGIEAAHHTIDGEAARLAGELAVVAADRKSWRHAARLLGCVEAHPGRRELPFASPREAERLEATRCAVHAALGDDAERHIVTGRHCSLSEAAGNLVLPR